MAASKSFSFEERDFSAASNVALAPGSLPDFEAVTLFLNCPHPPRTSLGGIQQTYTNATVS
jgi:hypothetical protein